MFALCPRTGKLKGQHLLQYNLKDLDSVDHIVLSDLKFEGRNLESLKIKQ